MEKTCPHPAAPTKARRGALALALLGAFGGFASFYLLLSVVPEYALHGGSGPVGAGLCTGALMLTTVAIQPVVPRLLFVVGKRVTLASGGLLLGLPCLVMNLSDRLPALMGLSLLRGCGFGIIVVIGVTAVAELTPATKWGQGMGLYGAVVGVAGIIGSPSGVWIAHRAGYRWTFIAGGIATVAVLVSASSAPSTSSAPPGQRDALTGAVRKLVPPFLIEGASTMAYGIVFTFLPLIVGRAPAWTAPTALLAVQASCTLSRLMSGKLVDRHGGAALLVPAIVTTAAGTVTAVFPANPVIVILGMAVFGAGFGVIQNASLVVMLHTSQTVSVGIGSVAWNLAFDAGTGAGAVGGGIALGATDSRTVFLTMAVLLLATVAAVRRRT
ncbi:MFS transporter [Streptomyces sp. SL13]|uniref:MFS transporter n=1 Tax=Streptantibioticus silvisoli TaxID=2705255 RepID=A0AA90KC01_9ACTN|nr:MFS transporter [Streptantibioticus silvisoli]MDI5973977.1 MFS transporter [Streptantibioticus silvisoli]